MTHRINLQLKRGAGIACWSERRTLDRKVASSNPGWSDGRIFFSRVNFACSLFIRCSFHPRVTAVVRKRLRLFCQKCRWQVTPKHAYTLDPTKLEWPDCAAIQAECEKLSGNELTCNSSGNTRSQSSQLAEPLWTDSGLKSGISMCDLISTLKKSVGGEWFVEHSPQILTHQEEATSTCASGCLWECVSWRVCVLRVVLSDKI